MYIFNVQFNRPSKAFRSMDTVDRALSVVYAAMLLIVLPCVVVLGPIAVQGAVVILLLLLLNRLGLWCA